MIVQVLLLMGLIKLLTTTGQPFLCSAVYTFVVAILGFFSGANLQHVLIGSVIAFVLASIYFWLLNKFEGSGIIWWVILIGGLFIGLI